MVNYVSSIYLVFEHTTNNLGRPGAGSSRQAETLVQLRCGGVCARPSAVWNLANKRKKLGGRSEKNRDTIRRDSSFAALRVGRLDRVPRVQPRPRARPRPRA